MEDKKNRVQYSMYNSLASLGCQILMIILQFVVRTVLIKTLGKSYLGITGLFSNILTLLSMTEFGVGIAITYRLYEPVRQQDEMKILQLMDLFKKAYRVIGTIVLIIGLTLMPFLSFLIKDADRLDGLGVSIYGVFGLYLLNSVVSYFFAAYKSEFIKVNQQSYLISLIQYAVMIAGSCLQIIALVFFHSFMWYVASFIAQTISLNLIAARLANRKYPYLRKRCDQPLTTRAIREIMKDSGAAFLYKINYTVLTATDNLVLSIFLGLDAVAVYSNYYAFFLAIHGVLDKIYNSIVHSIGNLHDRNNMEHEYDIFEIMHILTAILGGTAFVGIFVISNEVLEVWLGSGWSLGRNFSFMLGLQLYTHAYRFLLAKYREAYGLFRQAIARPIVCSISNIVLSVILVQKMGINGVVLGTLLSEWGTMIWFDPMIIHRYGFQNQFSLRRYFGKFIWYFVSCVCVCMLCFNICRKFFINQGWLSVIVHGMICATLLPLSMIVINWKSKEMKYLRRRILNKS